ncbi:MAG: hypothetical protein IPL61_34895 [Myxococcales bacterium]|nr:hypothetical protein [Myxococcales bacterium]
MRGAAAAVALALAACGGRDPIVGRWQSADARAAAVESFADARAELPVNVVEASCADAADVIAACARTQRWARRGDRYQLTVAAVGHQPRRTGSSFDPAGPCTCGHEQHELELRGDELRLVDGAERLRRLR